MFQTKNIPETMQKTNLLLVSFGFGSYNLLVELKELTVHDLHAFPKSELKRLTFRDCVRFIGVCLGTLQNWSWHVF